MVFIDEIDALQDQALISVLRQLRTGYSDRPAKFPWSLALIGLRDVRDYNVASGGSDRLHTSSPFNIKVESLTLSSFTHTEVAALYQQHTEDTGQVFLPATVARAAFLSRVVHGGGSVEREYAIGTRRMDLCVRYRRQILGMELKVSTTAESPSGRTITVVRA